MRRIQVQEGEVGVYHCISRVTHGEMRLDEKGREVLRKQMWQVAGFCGVEVLTYAILSNHFHMLVRIEPAVEVSNEELALRLEGLYGSELQAQTWAKWLREGGASAEAIRGRLLARMHSLSGFHKELKQRFSIWYNRTHGSFGTLWSSRFKSLLVEESSGAVAIVAAYIELNAVRAGLCGQPQDYRWCGYGEAMAGAARARKGLAQVMRAGRPPATAPKDWAATQRAYGPLLHDKTSCLARALRCRIRYFCDGAVLGSREFLQRWFQAHRSLLSPKRHDAPRPIRGPLALAAPHLAVYRDLRKGMVPPLQP